MTRFAFIQNLWTENLGIMYLAGILNSRGHEAKVFIDENFSFMSPGIEDTGEVHDTKVFRPQILYEGETSQTHSMNIE